MWTTATIRATWRCGCRTAACCMRLSSATSPAIPISGPITATAPPCGMLKQLEAMIALKPKVVVPAHGPLGDVTDLQALTDYLLSARQKVRAMMSQGSFAGGHREAVQHERVPGLGPRFPLPVDGGDDLPRAQGRGPADRPDGGAHRQGDHQQAGGGGTLPHGHRRRAARRCGCGSARRRTSRAWPTARDCGSA